MDEDTSCKIYQFPLLAGSACYNTGKKDAKYSKVQCDLNRAMYECSTSGDNRACDNDIINLPIDWLKLNEKCAHLGFSPLTDDELREINMHIGAYNGLYDGPKSEDHSEFVDTNLCKHTTSSIPFGLCNGTASWHQSINDASHITIRYLQTSLIQTCGSIAKSSHQKSYKKSLSLGAFCQTTTLNLVAYACIRCSTSKADRRRLLELNYGRGTWSQIQNKSDSDFDIDERTQRMLEKADRKADRL